LQSIIDEIVVIECVPARIMTWIRLYISGHAIVGCVSNGVPNNVIIRRFVNINTVVVIGDDIIVDSNIVTTADEESGVWGVW
jgi:hypothetical protein